MVLHTVFCLVFNRGLLIALNKPLLGGEKEKPSSGLFIFTFLSPVVSCGLVPFSSKKVIHLLFDSTSSSPANAHTCSHHNRCFFSSHQNFCLLISIYVLAQYIPPFLPFFHPGSPSGSDQSGGAASSLFISMTHCRRLTH